MRHGEAANRDDLGDGARFLTERGRDEVREVASAIAKAAAEVHVDRILTSPLVRAVQTAELMAAGLGFEGIVETLPDLSYTASHERAAKAIASMHGVILAVGHMPTMPATIQSLIGGGGPASLRTAQVVYLDGGRARWSAMPGRADLHRH